MKIYNGHQPKLVLLRSYLFVGISIVTVEIMQMGMREFKVVEGERVLKFAVTHNLVVSNALVIQEL